MHHSEILLQLDRQFGQQYISPAGMRELYESDNDGVDVYLEEVTYQFQYLVKYNILTATDNGFRSDDRFELSNYWGTLSKEEKGSWYSTVTRSFPDAEWQLGRNPFRERSELLITMKQYRIVFIEKSTLKEESLTMGADDINDALEQLNSAVEYTEIIKIERLN